MLTRRATFPERSEMTSEFDEACAISDRLGHQRRRSKQLTGRDVLDRHDLRDQLIAGMIAVPVQRGRAVLLRNRSGTILIMLPG